MSLDVICSGYLQKQGTSKGHRSISKKNRYFVLTDLFLYYYTEPPKEGKKNDDKLKGLIYLVETSLKPAEKVLHGLLLVTGQKEYIIAPTGTNEDASKKEMERWKHAIEFAIGKANQFTGKLFGGWLHKKGGKGHTHQNTKKRYFQIKGNLLMYYTEPNPRDNGIEGLKGWIDLSKTSSIEPLSANSWSLSTTDSKEYIIVAKDAEDCQRWLDAINDRIKLLDSAGYHINYALGEQIIKTGKIQKTDITPKPAGPAAHLYALTSSYLRFYPWSTSSASVVNDLGKDVMCTVPLLGCHTQLDERSRKMQLVDFAGRNYTLQLDSDAAFTEFTTEFAKQVDAAMFTKVKSGKPLRVSCLAFRDGGGEEFTLVHMSTTGIQFQLASSKSEELVPFAKIIGIELLNDKLLCMRYQDASEQNRLHLRSGNTLGLFSFFVSAMEALRLLAQQKNSPRPKAKKTGRRVAKGKRSGRPKKAATPTSPSATGVEISLGKKAIRQNEVVSPLLGSEAPLLALPPDALELIEQTKREEEERAKRRARRSTVKKPILASDVAAADPNAPYVPPPPPGTPPPPGESDEDEEEEEYEYDDESSGEEYESGEEEGDDQ